MKNQKGFTLVEGLLIVLIIAVVGFAGYYARNQQQDEPVLNETTITNNESVQDAEDSAETEEDAPLSDSWKLVASGQDGFSVRIPDGWKVINVMDSNWVTARTADSTVYQEGVPAAVEEFESFGTGGPARFNLIRFDDDNFRFLDGDEQNLGEFSAKNTKGTKYFKEYPEEVGEGIGPLPGQKQYTYMFEVGDSTTFVVYNQQISETDILEVVEELIATLTIN